MIRCAGPADVSILHRLIGALARYEHLSDEFICSEEQLRTHLFGARRYAEAIVAEDGSECVGFALYFHNYSTFVGRPGLYVEDIFVLPEHRRRGHGKALFRELARIAVDRGCGRFEWTVLDWNEPAVAFYRSLGAKVLPDWRVCRMSGSALVSLAARPQEVTD
jgi:GNAT superfamily N-acetyltransferase